MDDPASELGTAQGPSKLLRISRLLYLHMDDGVPDTSDIRPGDTLAERLRGY